MGAFMITIMFISLGLAVAYYLFISRGFTFRLPWSKDPGNITNLTQQQPHELLNCRVKLKEEKKDNCVINIFGVELSGCIHAPADENDAVLQITIADITDGLLKAKPVHSYTKQWRTQYCPDFCFNNNLGTLSEPMTMLTDWVSVGQLHSNWLLFPRKGKRDLEFRISVFSRQTNRRLASTSCPFTYENNEFGYIDLHENKQRTKTLAVPIAFAVSAADNKISDCEVAIIEKWAKSNIQISDASKKSVRQLDKAFNETIDFFRRGNQINIYQICKEVVEISSVAERYDILELCLHVAAADGCVSVEELTLLQSLPDWLELEEERFRSMMEKIIPASIHETEDIEVILGINSEMNKDQTRDQLNREYRKWNARITHADSEVQAQAHHMLELLGQARNKFLEQ
jgi:tellurite resistance protein